jgi:hypothetical protein
MSVSLLSSPPEREPRKGPKKIRPTPEQIATAVTDKRPSPVGQPTKVEITLRLVLPRPVLEALRARAIREGRNVEGLIQKILVQGAVKDQLTSPRPAREFR